ncbi:helix-turn-helix domain-containing protein [Kribbella sandramycini]|uniref:Helix-turn-helix domain-containing protein n=1 Tax=Kribbella sandramycini TaxID=60450 RepID=A0A7Y4KV15_9ACTN|nr:putative transcriptional regulator [Kribbella sandramycini]NOL39224.1 helix-turn-helix domain-containing protein [Kribbella sandramycini]
MRYIEEAETVRVALSPVRRRLLELLREPGSASELAKVLGVTRQRVNYQLRELEKAGLVEVVEERQRRGFVERVFRAVDGAVVVDPGVMGRAFEGIQDQYAAEHLVEVAAGTVRDVARMQAAAGEAGQRLLTFTLETEVRFAEPGDLHRFSDALADAVRQVVGQFDSGEGRAYRLIAGAHPAPRKPRTTEPRNEGETDE